MREIPNDAVTMRPRSDFPRGVPLESIRSASAESPSTLTGRFAYAHASRIKKDGGRVRPHRRLALRLIAKPPRAYAVGAVKSEAAAGLRRWRYELRSGLGLTPL